jgi:CDP-glucose 4,6-dehydratase
MQSIATALQGKRILVTGHTGFTGSWASIWLSQIGAAVMGVGLKPNTEPNLFDEAKIGDLVESKFVDIRDYSALAETFSDFKPELVLHLAAQPLVRLSYREPRETFDVNCQGTANVLEAARQTSSVKAILCITTDKVYKNNEWDRGYVEEDELGGRDPYSASKSAAEIVIASYKASFSDSRPDLKIAVARGGNIVGGGDWSEDRLIPDFIRASVSGAPMKIRYPQATRPWQHVLALVEGYLTLLSGLVSPDADKFARPFNLGPMETTEYSVGAVLELLSNQIEDVDLILEEGNQLHEAGKLALDSTLASEIFGWKPRWSTEEVIRQTACWYKSFYAGQASARELCIEQIDSWKNS